MRARLAAALVALAAGACTSELVAPQPAIEYALESVDGLPLPAVLLTDYDIAVSVISDVVTLRPDSSFVETAEFRGTSDDVVLTAVDSVAGTYSISGATLYLLLPGGKASLMRIGGDSLTQNAGRLLVYRRR
jgi:hypothetical protein